MKKLYILLTLVGLGLSSATAQKNQFYNIIMRNKAVDTMWDGKILPVYGFARRLSENPPIPGTPLYANEGDSLILEVQNISQGAPHTVHLHGLDVNMENDGTPMTSRPIYHLETKTYRALCNHAGTYIYHCHFGDVAHLQMGMYGLLIVRPSDGSKRAWTGGPEFSREYSFLFSEFDKSWHDTVPENPDHSDTLNMEQFKVPPYKPDYFLVNGKSKTQLHMDSSFTIKGKQNESIFLRMSNIGYYINEIIFPAELQATWIESDGRPLPREVRNDTLRIAPGERYGVMLKPNKQFSDSFPIRYINMNTMQTHDTEYLHFEINGLILGIEANHRESQLLSLWPNPASVAINIQVKDYSQPIQVRMTDITGREMLNGSIQNQDGVYQMPLAGQVKGIYFLHIGLGEKMIVRKVVKN